MELGAVAACVCSACTPPVPSGPLLVFSENKKLLYCKEAREEGLGQVGMRSVGLTLRNRLCSPAKLMPSLSTGWALVSPETHWYLSAHSLVLVQPFVLINVMGSAHVHSTHLICNYSLNQGPCNVTSAAVRGMLIYLISGHAGG